MSCWVEYYFARCMGKQHGRSEVSVVSHMWQHECHGQVGALFDSRHNACSLRVSVNNAGLVVAGHSCGMRVPGRGCIPSVPLVVLC